MSPVSTGAVVGPGGAGGRGSGGKEPPEQNLNLTPENPQWVCISARELHWDLYCLLGNGPITPSGGLSTFDEVTVPLGKTILSWTGQSLWSLELPLMFDTWGDDLDFPDPARRKKPPGFNDIEKKRKRKKARERWRRVRDNSAPSQPNDYLDLLVDLAQPAGQRHGREPGPIRVYGKALRPKAINGMAWHVTDWAWGENVIVNREGQLRRQDITLTLTEKHHGADVDLTHDKKGKGEKGTDQDWYVVKDGDTLMKIAAHVYGNANKWQRIADANNIKNPRKLKVGDRLKIPR